MVRLKWALLAAVRTPPLVFSNERAPLGRRERPKGCPLSRSIVLPPRDTDPRMLALILRIPDENFLSVARVVKTTIRVALVGCAFRQRRIASRAFSGLRFIHSRPYARRRSGSV